MKTKSFATLLLLALGLALAAPAHAENAGAPSPPPVAAHGSVPKVASVPHPRTLGSRAEDLRYAAREAVSPNAKKYKAGDVIVISATVVVIVLLAVIILILIV